MDAQITLSDGRRLAYAEYGDPAGKPLFYFHGWPSSRLEPISAGGLSSELGLRVIAPDRPGFGLSDFLPGRTIESWPGDVRQLTDHLGLERFGVLGVSGGGPYALACAARIPDRLSRALVVCSLSPLEAPGALQGMARLNRWMLSVARRAPWLASALARLCLWWFWGKGDQVIPRQLERLLPAADQLVLTRSDLRQALIASSREAFRDGVRGAAWEGILFSRPWGFRLEDIRVPVDLWHGERDIIVPCVMGRYLARKIPHCRASFYPEDGHFSLPFGRIKEILRAASA
jgi:pimeloyl-ACP methyl ester carboxylesterase